MSDRFDALALPPRDPYASFSHGPDYGTLPPEEPAILLRLARRFWKPLLACAVVSLGLAYLTGKYLGKPLWQAEATLLYQPIAFSEKQRMAYEHPPSLPTLAVWVKEPVLLRQIIDEFHLDMSEDDLGDKCIKVDQPSGTESIVVDFKWPDRDLTMPVLTRLLDLFSDYVALTRKEAILQRIEKMDQQAASACEDEIKRLDEQIKILERKLARDGKLSDEDMDGPMQAQKLNLQDDIRKNRQHLSELSNDLRTTREDYDSLKPVVEAQAESPIKLKTLRDKLDSLELQIKNARESIEASTEELRTLPIVLSKGKRFEQADKLRYLQGQLREHEKARAGLGKPGGPPAIGALMGMDAHEFSIKSPARVGDKPASSSKKTLFAMTFLGMMATAFGLLFVYDRRHPTPESLARRTRHPRHAAAGRVAAQRRRRSPTDGPHSTIGPRSATAHRHAATGNCLARR